ncbi:MAG: hypothetical protein M0Q53_21525 [Prolixibacteraceae bacterium]|jgi:hypothetical protein|nr:hypothetical protein [Prolixibacteraceae bacterium]
MRNPVLFIVTLFVALIAQSCSKEKIENDWKRDNLQGKVLFLSEFSYEAKERFGKIEKGNRIRSNDFDFQIKYDDQGNRIEVNEYNSDGSIYGRCTYKYNEKGNRIEENEYDTDDSLSSKYTYKYEYDTYGNWVKRIAFEDEIPRYILEREYEYYK